MTIYPICLYLGCWEQLFVFLTQAPLKMTIQQWLFSRCVRGNHLPPAPGAWSICFGRVRETDGVTTKLGGAGFATWNIPGSLAEVVGWWFENVSNQQKMMILCCQKPLRSAKNGNRRGNMIRMAWFGSWLVPFLLTWDWLQCITSNWPITDQALSQACLYSEIPAIQCSLYRHCCSPNAFRRKPASWTWQDVDYCGFVWKKQHTWCKWCTSYSNGWPSVFPFICCSS